MKTGHIADLHHSPERHKKVMRILDQTKEIMPDIDLLTNSGENFNNPYNIGEIYNQLLDKWGEITRDKPVATIKATQGKHEREGMLKGLQKVGIKILEPGYQYMLSSSNTIVLVDKDYEAVMPKLQLFGVPHAHKGKIVMGSMSRDEANAKVNQEMVKLYNYYGALRAQNPNIPALAVGHGVVQGKNTRDLHAIKNSSIYSTEAELKLMGCDFYAWGHYHPPTMFELINGRYLGSFAWDFGELNYKPAITIVDWDTMEVSRHELDINIRKKYVMFPDESLPDMTGFDVHLVNNKTEWTESDCKEAGAGQVKVTTEVEVENKIRSKEVVEAVTYPDKFKAVYPKATDRQLKVCDEMWEADKAEGKIPEKKVITPLYVEIHGSINFLERMGKETIRIDLRDHDGLVMLIGDGGLGKSTLFDYMNPFSMLFAQGNPLLSTFEMADSYIEQGWDINGEVFIIKKFFKPTLKNPKAEYFAFKENGEKISGLDSGNRGPFDDWCLSMFGSPRRYSSSVFNTQFDDNPKTFQGQKINPSIFQSDSVELKSLFHELTGTDLKHLEMKCKVKADEFKDLSEAETLKKAGVEENIPSRAIIDDQILNITANIAVKASTLGSEEKNVSELKLKVEAIETQEQSNRDIVAAKALLVGQRNTETENKTSLEGDLKALGSVDIDSVNKEIQKMDSDKVVYDTRISDLPGIKEENVKNQKTYMKSLEDWNTSNLKLTEHNLSVDRIKKEIDTAGLNKIKSVNRKQEKIEQAAKDQTSQNNTIRNQYNTGKYNIESSVKTLNDQIKTGNEMIENIKKCPNCDYMDPEALENKSKYGVRVKQRETELKTKEQELIDLKEPELVDVVPDFSEENKEISEYDEKINQVVPDLETVPDKPEEPKYPDETMPFFDHDKYASLKDKVSSYSESKITELQTKISESTKRIASLQSQIDSKETVEIDRSPVESLKTAEDKVKSIEKEIAVLNTDITLKRSKIADIEKMRESLVEYDKRIDKYNEEFEFWADMRVKWGPKGIPARILEHTGPYVDQEANNILKKYYPIYRVHSETTKMSSDGKKELEVFNISVVNQETTRTKPLNCISGEERNFVNEALRYAFRKVNEQNSLVRFNVLFEDEPDAHVSSSMLHEFWNMVDDIRGDRTIFAIAHSPEVKQRSATTLEIRDLGV